jgi:acetylornithine deacetylase/succinyl-diaminopimelate desuccinylase-like protein
MSGALPDTDTLVARTLDLLAEWVAIPSAADDPAALRLMAQAVADFIRTRLGARIVDDGWRSDPPLVHARIDRGAGRRILLYNMYDVMPASSAGWSVDPFRGGIVELAPFGRCFVARGAENNKGPLAGMLVALEALLVANDLDADVEILIEGEEESGSRGLRRYLLDPATPVARCATALFPSFCEYGGGPPRVYLGSKGIVHGRIRASGGAWGGPRRAIHSSNAPWIANPAWRLISACSRIAPNDTGTLGRIPLPPGAGPVLDRLAAAFDADAELRFRQTGRYAVEGSVRTRLETVLTTTSLNLASIRTEPSDGSAVIPAAAEARFDLRLPPGVAPDTALNELRATLHAADLDDIEITAEHGYPGHAFSADDPAAAALVRCYQKAGCQPQIWPWAIGAAPVHAFAAVADSFLLGGLGRGGNAHGVDEFVTLDGLRRFLTFLLDWLPATASCVPKATSPSGDAI